MYVIQVLAPLNVRLEFGPATRPKGPRPDDEVSECLISVYATEPIEAGAELLTHYGANFWQDNK